MKHQPHRHIDEENHCLFNNLIYFLDKAPLPAPLLCAPANIRQLLDFNYDFEGSFRLLIFAIFAG